MHSRTDVLSCRARCLLSGITVATLVLACGGTTTEQIIGPTASRCQIAVAAPPPAVPASGTSVSLNVSAARDCTWTVATEAVWMTASPTSGQGNGAVAITVTANMLGSSRSSAVVVNDTRITIDQQGMPCRFEVRGTRVGFEGGRTSVPLSTLDGCQWRASTSAEWVRVLTRDGTGSGSIDLDVSRNDGVERSATVTVESTSFALVQESASRGPVDPAPSPPGAPPPPPGACSFSIAPETATVRSTAGEGSVRIVTQPGCSWTASAGSSSWITVQRSSGNGPDTVAYQVSANFSTVSDRSGSIDVAGRTHRVTQQACDLSIEPGLPHLPAGSGSYDFRVTTGDGCTWTAHSTVGWINVTSPRGTGSGRVTYQLSANTERGRDGTIVVSGRTKLITQYGVY